MAPRTVASLFVGGLQLDNCSTPPDSVDTLRGSYGSSEAPVLDRCVARPCPANSLLFTVHPCLSKSSTCISTAQARNLCGWSGCLSRPHSRCGDVRIFGHGGHFSWQTQGKLSVFVVQSRPWRSKVVKKSETRHCDTF